MNKSLFKVFSVFTILALDLRLFHCRARQRQRQQNYSFQNTSKVPAINKALKSTTAPAQRSIWRLAATTYRCFSMGAASQVYHQPDWYSCKW